ncbi:unnamed protein product [[Actinomadura] parvosata subsp. kistnae]|nr:unnamed protein product [Actinomadura parvosata subsp. kistnae]
MAPTTTDVTTATGAKITANRFHRTRPCSAMIRLRFTLGYSNEPVNHHAR